MANVTKAHLDDSDTAKSDVKFRRLPSHILVSRLQGTLFCPCTGTVVRSPQAAALGELLLEIFVDISLEAV